ncbi:MAG: hypothetical protein LBK73_06625 [Treponema sp.]|jgi:hypothetical protein|nr:hypothetical protein [Treponema sp.]
MDGRKSMMVAAILLMAISGRASAPEKKLGEIAATAPDAVSWLVNAFKTEKIVFINETHVVINEEMFLTEHLRTCYDAGVRYVFIESELVANDVFVPSYPWMLAGGRLEHDDMKYAHCLWNGGAGDRPIHGDTDGSGVHEI